MADATTPRAQTDHGTPTATDTHTCEPRWWPHHIGEHWECECGHGYHVARACDMPGELSAKAIRLGVLKPDTLGWCSDDV